jgi:hypothetical protein
VLKKPFEASVVLEVIKPLIDAAHSARGVVAETAADSTQDYPSVRALSAAPVTPSVDPERVRAAVTLALDAALPAMIEEITERVLVALGH